MYSINFFIIFVGKTWVFKFITIKKFIYPQNKNPQHHMCQGFIDLIQSHILFTFPRMNLSAEHALCIQIVSKHRKNSNI